MSVDEKNAGADTQSSVPIQASGLYTFVDQEELDLSTPMQPSSPIPAVKSQDSTAITPNVPARTRGGGSFGIQRLSRSSVFALIVASILLLGAVGTAVYAQGSLQASLAKATGRSAAHPVHTVSTRPPAHARATATPTAIVTVSTSSGVPQTPPAGWTAAGLNTADEFEALRTGLTFVDREMSLDHRNVGTRAVHGGTFTAAVFVLTQAARARFAQNDVRMANNVLFDRVQQRQLIQEVANVQPQVVKFAVQGQQQFAWVDVSFQLWQSQIDLQSGNRVEGFEIDAATGKPRIHHMIVLLLRVPPAAQGPNAPMGGTGWLVSLYALDTGGTLPDVLEPA
jgi:hypothetical protein